MRWTRAVLTVCFGLAVATPALAHSAARGFVLLLPTSYIIAGGALAVLASFVVVSLLPGRYFRQAAAWRMSIGSAPVRSGGIISLISALVLILLIWVGLSGPEDPLENLLPLSVWTLWWAVIVLLHPVFGNLWAWLNPFTGPHALLNRLSGGRLQTPPCTFPGTLAYWPAVLIFAAFAWFQLVYPAPEDPPALAWVVAIYAGLTLLAVSLFGPAVWLSKGDPFAVFLWQLGAAAPLGSAPAPELRMPGAGLLSLPALPLMGTLFVLLTLSAISFDAFSNTFVWLSMTGVNPLDYPGRTALISINTFGLAACFAVLALAYTTAIAAGWMWAGKPGSLQALLGRFVFSLIPVSIAFHFAHTLSDMLVNLQYVALALNNPLGNGANLLGLANSHVTTSFQNTASGTLAVFMAQTAAIVIGHTIAVAAAHTMAIQSDLPHRTVLKLEAPLAAVMVLYTAFGIWLLAAAAIR